jgi:O-antigen/teichoic acid export membrane protein
MSDLQTDKRFLFKSSLYNIAGNVLKVLGPALMIVVARVFGPAEFGLYVANQMLVLTISRIAVLGLDKGMYWYLPQNKLAHRLRFEGIAPSFWLTLLIACSGIGISWAGLLTPWIERELPWYMLSLLPYTVSHLLGATSEGNRKPQYTIFINDVGVAALTPLIALALHFLEIPHALPIALFASKSVGMVVHLFVVRKQFPEMPWSFGVQIPRELFKYSLPMGFSEFVVAFLLRADVLMVMYILGPVEAGVYGLMNTLSNGLRTIRTSFNPLLTPVVAGMEKDRLKTDLKGVYSYCVSWVTLIQLVIGFFIVLFPKEILGLAGKEFIVQPETLGILLFVHLFAGFWGMTGVVINGLGKSLYTLKMNVASLALALVLNALLVPTLGLVGAALSKLGFNLLQCVWNNAYLARMKLKLYARSLLPLVFWALVLVLLYTWLGFYGHDLSLWAKLGLYLVLVGALCGSVRLSGTLKKM